jgi:hypothetical protein
MIKMRTGIPRVKMAVIEVRSVIIVNLRSNMAQFII